jgi:cardiolipin-specific phospholipase
VKSLDKWREAQGLETMVLVGHSFGGYLSSCYAETHPERVTHLTLVGPAGVAHHVSCNFHAFASFHCALKHKRWT